MDHHRLPGGIAQRQDARHFAGAARTDDGIGTNFGHEHARVARRHVVAGQHAAVAGDGAELVEQVGRVPHRRLAHNSTMMSSPSRRTG